MSYHNAGMTLETRKAQIRTSKLVEFAVKKAAEAELTDEAYKKHLRTILRT